MNIAMIGGFRTPIQAAKEQLNRRHSMAELTVSMDLFDDLGILPNIFRALDIKVEIEPTFIGVLESDRTGKERQEIESVSISISKEKRPDYMTAIGWIEFINGLTLILQTEINKGAKNYQDQLYLNLIEGEVEALRATA